VDALDRLIDGLPPGTVSTHPGELATHARDRWPLAMLRDVRGDRVPPPGALAFPQSTEHVATVLRWARETGTPVVPRGGASGLSGGAEAIQRSLVLDLSRMNAILGIDEVSQTVDAQAGVRGGHLEAAVNERGLATGHYPASLEISTVGGWIASGGVGYAAAGYGGIEDLLLGLTAVLGTGDVVELKAVPRPGAGPDLRRLLVGSEGTLAVVTEATLALARRSAGVAWEAFGPRSFETGAALVREMLQRGFRPMVLRLFDPGAADSAFSAFLHHGPLVVVGFDGGAPAVEAVRFALKELARGLGARALGQELPEHWWAHRHDGVAWQEGVMGEERTLGTGVVVGAVDVATVWRRVARAYEEIRGTLLEHAETVGCRLVAAYTTGAALQFSFVIREQDDHEAERAYRQMLAEATAACLTSGASIAHHQGIGLLRAPFMEQEVGAAGLEALRGIKVALDPAGILNPGKLIPGASDPPA
jgi:alkyldihydroxyacetonephosphate synthase